MFQVVPKWQIDLVLSDGARLSIWISDNHVANVLRQVSTISFSKDGLVHIAEIKIWQTFSGSRPGRKFFNVKASDLIAKLETLIIQNGDDEVIFRCPSCGLECDITGMHVEKPDTQPVNVEALQQHVEVCNTCRPNRGHMPYGFCKEGIRLFERIA